jgi:hypothetical protein
MAKGGGSAIRRVSAAVMGAVSRRIASILLKRSVIVDQRQAVIMSAMPGALPPKQIGVGLGLALHRLTVP